MMTLDPKPELGVEGKLRLGNEGKLFPRPGIGHERPDPRFGF